MFITRRKLIQFKNVEKKYSNGVYGVRDIDITIGEGEFTFLIGPSGSGKTTLIKMLIRDENPSSGNIYFDDVDITNISRGRVYKLRRQVGVIFQDFKLIPDKTAFENVAFAMEAAGRKNSEIKEKVPYLLDVVGLKTKMKSFPKQLSGGEQQRVAIARAMANNPRMLIADEPTGNLDPKSAWDIVQILTKINSWGTTVIMSTHGTEIVNALNKRVIQMEGGRVVRDDAEGEYEFKSEDEIPEDLASHLRTDLDGSKAKKSLKLDLTNKVSESEDDSAESNQGSTAAFMGRLDETDENTEVENKKLFIDLSQNDTKSELDRETSVEKEETPRLDILNEKKLMEQLSALPVEYLHIPEEVAVKLNKAGYENMRQVVEDGPEKLSEHVEISEEEVVTIAQAIEKALKNK